MKKYLLIVLLIGVWSCEDDNEDDNDEITIVDQNIDLFLSALPENMQYPSNNPYSQKKEHLGKLLYWDPILSGGKDVSCATCHHPQLGYADELEFSEGVGGSGLGLDRQGGIRTKRNSPSIINSGFNGIDNNGHFNPESAPMFWDNRVESLEQQALSPMVSKAEMRGNIISEEFIMDTIIQRLNAIPEYVSYFEQAYGNTEINQNKILNAIATFERGIISNNSRFDQYMRGDTNSMSPFEIRGMNAFIQVGCADCHSGPMFSDFKLHTIGVRENGTPIDQGATNKFDFRTPTLRNLNSTAPYMHNGLFNTLEDVLDFYEDMSEGDDDQLNINVSENALDEEILDLEFDDDLIDELKAFLNTLNDENFDKTIPTYVPSNLSVGGNIE